MRALNRSAKRVNVSELQNTPKCLLSALKAESLVTMRCVIVPRVTILDTENPSLRAPLSFKGITDYQGIVYVNSLGDPKFPCDLGVNSSFASLPMVLAISNSQQDRQAVFHQRI